MLNHNTRFWLISLACGLAVSHLQADGPELAYLFPLSGRAGSTVEVDLVGKSLDAVDRLYASRPGIESRRVRPGRLAISIPSDASPSECDVWAVSPQGLSLPVRFVIATMPGHVEQEPNTAAKEAQTIAVPAVVSGRIDPGTDCDWYRVRLAEGDGLTVHCRSTTLGGSAWPTITVLDPHSREIAHDSMTRLEPTLHLRVTVAGDYLIGVQDRAYRSTRAPFYQLTMTTGPWLVSAYPTALQRASPQRVTLYGYHLPGGRPAGIAQEPLEQLDVEITAPDRGQMTCDSWKLSRAVQVETVTYRHPGVDNQVQLELLDRAPERELEVTDEGTRRSETPLTPPSEVAGRFASARSAVDWFRFSATGGTTLWIEAVAERLNRPCDLELVLHDTSGKPLETLTNISSPKGQTPLVPIESRDPAGSWKVPANGDYLLAVRELLNTSSIPGERSYRLSIGPRSEGFRVVALLGTMAKPQAWSLLPGKKITVSLAALRRGGHQGAITVQADALPPGLKVQPVTIAANQDTGNLVIEAAPDATPWVGAIGLTATSDVERQPRTMEVYVALPLAGSAPPVARLCDEAVVGIGADGER